MLATESMPTPAHRLGSCALASPAGPQGNGPAGAIRAGKWESPAEAGLSVSRP